MGWNKDSKGWWYSQDGLTYYQSDWKMINGNWFSLILKGMHIKIVGSNMRKMVSGITLMIIAIWYLTNGFLIMENGTD
ncbi:hypothetical protein [Clostridium butyricum]